MEVGQTLSPPHPTHTHPIIDNGNNTIDVTNNDNSVTTAIFNNGNIDSAIISLDNKVSTIDNTDNGDKPVSIFAIIDNINSKEYYQYR